MTKHKEFPHNFFFLGKSLVIFVKKLRPKIELTFHTIGGVPWLNIFHRYGEGKIGQCQRKSVHFPERARTTQNPSRHAEIPERADAEELGARRSSAFNSPQQVVGAEHILVSKTIGVGTTKGLITIQMLEITTAFLIPSLD